jgi:hypothetical protein
MPIDQDILNLLPIGEQNAVSSRLLWKQLGVWAPSSIKLALSKLSAAGRIGEKGVQRDGRYTILYFQLPGTRSHVERI